MMFHNDTASTHTDPTISMMNSTTSSSSTCDVCGWIAALLSMIAFGSFGVPIKSKAAISVDIDPLVFQSYKTFICFITSWLVVVIPMILSDLERSTRPSSSPSSQHQQQYAEHHNNNQPDSSNHIFFHFTPWGIVSGLFWVPGGVAAVYGIQHAGLAITIGISASCIVLVSFIWGIFIFQEPIHSKWIACIAILCIMMGLMGMSYYSNPTTTNHHPVMLPSSDEELSPPDNNSLDDHCDENNNRNSNNSIVHELIHSTKQASYQVIQRYDDVNKMNVDDDVHISERVPIDGVLSRQGTITRRSFTDSNNDNNQVSRRATTVVDGCYNTSSGLTSINKENDDEPMGMTSSSQNHRIIDGVVVEADTIDDSSTVGLFRTTHVEEDEEASHPSGLIVFWGYQLTKRQQGMMAAMFNGIWGGSIMVPMKWSNTQETKGIGYLPSFAIGASIVNILLWVIRYLYGIYYYQSIHIAYHTLPSFHCSIMFIPGGISGLLWSIGNFFSLLSVYYLGEGVGYPLVQTALIISGLWGIFHFHEVHGTQAIMKWFLSASITLYGIILLSYEHYQK